MNGRPYGHLFEVLKKRTVWVVVIKDTEGIRQVMEQLFDSEQKAR